MIDGDSAQFYNPNSMAKINPLSDFERFARRVVEGSIDRLFLGENDLLLIARQLISAVDASEQNGKAANEYIIRVGPGMIDQNDSNREELIPLLERIVEGYLEEDGRDFDESLKIELISDSTLASNDIAIESYHVDYENKLTRRYRLSGTNKPEKSLSGRQAFLIIAGKRHLPINKAVLTIGRQLDNEIIIESSSVSRHHAQVKWRFGQFILHDLSSRTGTRVNGQVVSDSILRPGDVIEVGNTKLIFGERGELGDRRNVLPGDKGDTKPLPPINEE